MSQIRQHRPLLIGAGLLVLLAAVATVGLRLTDAEPPLPRSAAHAPDLPTQTQAQAQAQAQAPTQPQQNTGAGTKPGFDTLRVSPEGTAVIAGTAVPHQEVIVRDGGQEIGRATADGAGQWVMTPDKPLLPGAKELTLAARDATGHETAAPGSVLVVVPDPKAAVAAAQPTQRAAAQVPLAVLTPATPGAASRVLQAPGAAGRSGRLDLDVIDYDDHGAVTFAGHAPPDARVQVYVDNALVAGAVAGAGDRWSAAPSAIAPGRHAVRVDQLDARGKVIARVELPFVQESVATAVLAGGRVVVQPGASLWRLARQAYGSGARYTVIYAWNTAQIRNPSLIYPGQALVVPAADAPLHP